MPSGDSAAAAVFCVIIGMEMHMPWVFLSLPLVMLGRVYYQCHWLGDTVIGACVGTFWGVLGYMQFLGLLPMLVMIAGENSFQPNSSEPPVPPPQ